MKSNKISVKIYCLILFITVLFSGYYKFYDDHLGLPKGCDEFGYLQLAEYVVEGNVFYNHNETIFLYELRDFLKKDNIDFKNYSWLITPHCHHIDMLSGKKINQYPLATSILLSIFNKEIRTTFFPIVVFIMLFIPVYLTLMYMNSPDIKILFTFVVLSFLIVILSDKHPFGWHLRDVNSVAVTFGLILSAGFLLQKNPYLSIIILSFLVNFRLANFIIIPFLFFLIYNFRNNYIYNLWQLTKLSLISFLVGPFIYLYYVFILTGSFFNTTYSSKDRTSILNYDILRQNFNFYINFENSWFVLQFFSLLILFILYLSKIVNFKIFLVLILTSTLNYVFFINHKNTHEYYPYASTVLVFGYLIYIMINKIQFKLKYLKISSLVFIFIFISSGFYYKFNLDKNNLNSFESEKIIYNNCFKDKSVVWSENSSGTVEYISNSLGFRLLWGNNESRLKVINWLIQNNHKQYFIIDDFKNSRLKVETFLNENDVNYKTKYCYGLGKILEI